VRVLFIIPLNLKRMICQQTRRTIMRQSMIHIHRLIALLIATAVFVMFGCAGTQTSRSTGTYIDDKSISTKVEAQLAADSLTQAIQVEVETYNGVVQLSGFVDKEQTIQRAEQITRGVAGVKDVKNNLILRK